MQSLYEILKRGINISSEQIFLGLTTNGPKRKFGATQIPQIGFMQSIDNFKLQFIENLKFSG